DVFLVESTLATTPLAVRAGQGNDVLVPGYFDNSALPGAVTFDGQAGTDTLDYTGYTRGVRVNLALGTATGLAGGVSNVENVGDGQANVRRGGGGRDIIVGRGAADSLRGEGGDDILIGASTAHDLAPARLEDLMREWGRTDLPGWPLSQYDARVNHLLGAAPG